MELMESIVCPGCGSLCDDIDLTVEDGEIKDVINVCAWGLSKFKGTRKFHPDRKRARLVQPSVRQGLRHRTVEMEDALAKAADILSKAKRPLVCGLVNIGYRAQVEAFELAREIGGVYEPEGSRFRGIVYDAWEKSDLPILSLEEIKDKADCSIFWGFNPLHSCPRFLTRYALFPRGKFTERGFEDRKAFVVDVLETEMKKFAGQFLTAQPGNNAPVADALKALVAGQEPEQYSVKKSRLKEMAEQIRSAALVAVFVGRGVGYDPAPEESVEAIFSLMAELNENSRCAFFPVYNEFNACGADMVLSRKTGHVRPADFSDPPVVGKDGESAFDRLEEIDAILSVGSDLFWMLPEEKIDRIREGKIPLIVVSPYFNRTTGSCEVAIPAAVCGIEEEEIAYRMDGVPLTLKRIVPAAADGTKDILKRMRELIR